MAGDHRRPAADVRAAARLYATGGNAAIYYGLGVTEHSQGSTMVMGMANLAMATGNIGQHGRRREPAPRAEQRPGLLRHGLLPARVPRLPPHLRRATRAACSRSCGASTSTRARPAHPQHVRRRASTARSRASTSRARTSPSPTPTPSTSRPALAAMECVVVQDLFLNETAKLRPRLPARLVVPREGRHLHQRRAPHQPRAQVMRRKVGMAEWEVTCAIAQGDGLRRCATRIPSEIMDEIAASPRRSPASRYEKLDEVGIDAVAVQRRRRPTARRSCTSAGSCAARASS